VADLESLLKSFVDAGLMSGAVGLIARRDRVEVAAVGFMAVEGSAPMTRDAVFRVASITKPITVAAAIMLVHEGRLRGSTRSRRGCPSWPRPWWSGRRTRRSRTSSRLPDPSRSRTC
jgi:hypothetical protein